MNRPLLTANIPIRKKNVPQPTTASTNSIVTTNQHLPIEKNESILSVSRIKSQFDHPESISTSSSSYHTTMEEEQLQQMVRSNVMEIIVPIKEQYAKLEKSLIAQIEILRVQVKTLTEENNRLQQVCKSTFALDTTKLRIPSNITNETLMTRCFARVENWNELRICEELKGKIYEWVNEQERLQYHDHIWKFVNSNYICVSHPHIVNGTTIWMRFWGLDQKKGDWLFGWVAGRWKGQRVLSSFELVPRDVPKQKEEEEEKNLIQEEELQEANHFAKSNFNTTTKKEVLDE